MTLRLVWRSMLNSEHTIPDKVFGIRAMMRITYGGLIMDYNYIRERDADMLYEYWREYGELPEMSDEYDYLCGLSDEELEEVGL